MPGHELLPASVPTTTATPTRSRTWWPSSTTTRGELVELDRRRRRARARAARALRRRGRHRARPPAAHLRPARDHPARGPGFTVDGQPAAWERWRCGSRCTRSRGWCSTRSATRRRRPPADPLPGLAGEMVVPYGSTRPATGGRTPSTPARSGSAKLRELAGARLRLPRRDPLPRRRRRRRGRRRGHDPAERHLHARGGLRHPLEALRLAPATPPRCAGRAAWSSAPSPRSATTSTASTGTSTSTAPSS